MAGGKLRHKKILKLAKGYKGRAKNVYSVAVNRVEKGLQYAYTGRRLKKRNYRKVNAAARLHGVRYKDLIHSLSVADIELNRKVLADLAITEPYSFKAVVETGRVVSERRREAGEVTSVPPTAPGARARRGEAARGIFKGGEVDTVGEAWRTAKSSMRATGVAAGAGVGSAVPGHGARPFHSGRTATWSAERWAGVGGDGHGESDLACGDILDELVVDNAM